MAGIYCAPLDGQTGSAAVYALLERAFRAEHGGAAPRIAKTPAGKPYFTERPEIHFSLSHTKTHVLCVVSSVPVGADIESPRQISRRAISYFSSPGEQSLFDPLDLWVLKESYIKLRGGTLALIKSSRFSLDGSRVIAPEEGVFSKLYNIAGCRAAVSTLGAPPPDQFKII